MQKSNKKSSHLAAFIHWYGIHFSVYSVFDDLFQKNLVDVEVVLRCIAVWPAFRLLYSLRMPTSSLSSPYHSCLSFTVKIFVKSRFQVRKSSKL